MFFFSIYKQCISDTTFKVMCPWLHQILIRWSSPSIEYITNSVNIGNTKLENFRFVSKFLSCHLSLDFNSCKFILEIGDTFIWNVILVFILENVYFWQFNTSTSNSQEILFSLEEFASPWFQKNWRGALILLLFVCFRNRVIIIGRNFFSCTPSRPMVIVPYQEIL